MTLTEMTALLNAAKDNRLGSDYAGFFDISTDEAERIAASAASAEQFVDIWENTDWWTDENNA